LTSFEGKIKFDTSFPSGQSRRDFSLEKIKSISWKPRHSLKEGLEKTILWYKENQKNVRER